MKKYILLFLGVLTLNACSDILDVRDASVISPDIWDSEQSATLFINRLYSQMPTSQIISGSTSPFGNHASFSDEAIGSNKFVNGEYTYDEIGVFGATYYNNIRNINIAIERLQESTMSESAKNRILGQAYFIRAWTYWNLVVVYGGIPYVTESLNPYIDDSIKLDPPRNKTSECIQYLCDDLDKAVAALPATTAEYMKGIIEYSRVTRSAAAALKGRILLYYASPQFNPGNIQSRWEDAYQANKQAETIAIQDGFALLDNGLYDPVTGSFAKIFQIEGAGSSGNTEALFVKAYDYSVSVTHGWENSVRPYVAGAGTGGQGSNPTWDLVKSFPMKNGLSVYEAGSGWDSTYYWKNRDPRFYATIGYNGCTWVLSGMSGSKIWSYEKSNTETKNGTNTGFYCRKMTNPTIAKETSNSVGTDWIEIRLAEVFMNLAECANETNRQSEAISLIGKIRKRAGIEIGEGNYGLKSTYTDKVELTSIIMNERFIEFAYENKRMWDLRRRNMYYENLGNYNKLNGRQRWTLITKIKYPAGVITPPQKTTYENTLITTRDAINMDANFTTYFTNSFSKTIGDINYPIVVPTKYAFFAIPQNILNRSKAIKQTQGWGNGTDEFNPYE